MAEYTVTLSESTYQSLLEEVQSKGTTIDNWIVSQLNSTAEYSAETVNTQADETQPPNEFPGDLIGSVDSSKEPNHSQKRTDFSEILKAKFEKQGLRLP